MAKRKRSETEGVEATEGAQKLSRAQKRFRRESKGSPPPQASENGRHSTAGSRPAGGAANHANPTGPSDQKDTGAAKKRSRKRKQRKASKALKATSDQSVPAEKATTTGAVEGTPSITHSHILMPEEIQGVTPQAPKDLSKGQRKRWRRDRRRSELFASTSQHDSSAGQKPPKLSRRKKSRAEHGISEGLDRAALLRLATTRLVPLKAKEWKDHGEGPARQCAEDSTPELGAASRPSSRSSPSSASIPSGPAPRSAERVAPQSDPKPPKTNSVSSRGASPSASSSRHSIPESIPKATPAEYKQLQRLQPPPPAAVSFRTTSVSSKPNSVPSQLEDSDVKAAFRRFSAFVNGGDSDSSDDESENSESESEEEPRSQAVPAKPADGIRNGGRPSSSTANKTPDVFTETALRNRMENASDSSLATQPQQQTRTLKPSQLDGDQSIEVDTDQGNNRERITVADNKTAAADSQQRRTAGDDTINSAGITESSEDESEGESDAGAAETPPRPISKDEQSSDEAMTLPNGVSSQLAQATSAPNSSWPANVGIKRQGSFLGLETGGAPSGTGSAHRASKISSPSQPDPFDVTEADADAALLALDEVSEGMLTATRPLPASKFDSPPEPVQLEGTKLMDVDSSDRRWSRGMVEGFWHFKDAQKLGPALPVSVICNAARMVEDDVDTAVTDSFYVNPATSESSMGENINVAMHGPAGSNSDSSSPLSNFSRTPTPPNPVARSEPPLNDLAHQIPVRDRTESADDTIAVQSVPKKKRKMTGTTSKHFSPEKKPRRTTAPAIVSVEQTLDAGDEEREAKMTPCEETSGAVDMMKSTFSARPAIRRRRAPQAAKSATRRHSQPVPAEDPDQNPVVEDAAANICVQEPSQAEPSPTPTTPTPVKPKKKRKSTGKKSTYFTPPKPLLDPTLIDRVDFYNTTASGRKARVPAGTSIAPIPPISCPYFGIIQEKLWREPFWLLIATTFLNKTTGRAAAPVFWGLKEQYGTPEGLAEADEEELRGLVWKLGLYKARSRRCIEMAKAWVEKPPVKGTRWRTLHYPAKGDGRELKKRALIEGDAVEVEGGLEIGHVPGCGPYAWDSWRIFCRDVVRGVAEDYNGKGARVGEGGEVFEPEWKRVLPLDKELRACLRWMWLREGWIWDHETGEKRAATEEEMEKAVKGEMEFQDPQERKFAAQAAGAEAVETNTVVADGHWNEVEKEQQQQQQQQPALEMDGEGSVTDASSNIVVVQSTPAAETKSVRRSRRLTTSELS
ncbi:uncharacterized protein LTR77_002291 [Saxophila tyrrhenica]|uniref:HhH-GPD domain-containing protein n=1 Tax=Saxophila tyrrhenica TaxID=1690608 RepID=A0AAV9PLM8_9PEZI|nr:hypothetical protein LTR77_002291 [Saxophila tyrrhenica]